MLCMEKMFFYDFNVRWHPQYTFASTFDNLNENKKYTYENHSRHYRVNADHTEKRVNINVTFYTYKPIVNGIEKRDILYLETHGKPV